VATTETDTTSVLDALFQRRLLVVTGKGGTGKTSLAAALARRAAAAGKRVLACEVGRDLDSPSPLLALLAPGRAAKNEPQALEGELAHVVLRGDDGVRQFLGDVMPFQFMANRALKVEAVRRFLDAAPAFGEMGVLYRGMKFLEERRRDGTPTYELMILDAPASGHTLAFAALPDTILKVFTAGPIATAARAGIELIRNPRATTVVAATLPEPLPVSEVTELCAGLRERGLDVGAVVANQVPHDPFSADERAALDAALPLEVLGRNALARMTKAGEALRRLATLGAPVLRVGTHASSGPALVSAIMGGLAPGVA
jgi:arsenite-transporting ATPase